MANTPPLLVANGNILPCRFLKLDATADDRCLQAAANDKIIGISMEGARLPPLSDMVTTNYHAIAGDPVQIYGDGDVCLVEAGAAVAVGDYLKADADGKGIPIATAGTTLQRYGAQALQAASGAGVKIRVAVMAGRSERPALA